MKKHRVCAAGLGLIVLFASGSAAGGAASPGDPLPTSPLAGLEAAFATHRLVAVTDPRTPSFNRLVVSLMQNRAFRAHARVILYDCCAPRYQALVDRYVNGGRVSLTSVSRAWARAGPPIPRPNLFVAARTLNRRLGAEQRIRIVLAHPWAPPRLTCKRGTRCLVWGDRLDRVVADVAERVAFRRGENALLLAGYWKLDRRRRRANPGGYGLDSAARRIERRHPGSLFLVWALKLCRSAESNADELAASWPSPAFADIRGTSVGLAPETVLWSCVKPPGLRGLPLARPSVDRHVEDDVDAILTGERVSR